MSEMWYTYWLACVEGITGGRKCELCRKNGSAEAVYYIEEKGIREQTITEKECEALKADVQQALKELEGSVSKSGGPGNSDGSPWPEKLSEAA